MIYLLYASPDTTEGKLPAVMLKDYGYFTSSEEAWAIANTIPGVMGRLPKNGDWRNETCRDIEVRAIPQHNSEYFAKKQQLEAEIAAKQEELKKLTRYIY